MSEFCTFYTFRAWPWASRVPKPSCRISCASWRPVPSGPQRHDKSSVGISRHIITAHGLRNDHFIRAVFVGLWPSEAWVGWLELPSLGSSELTSSHKSGRCPRAKFSPGWAPTGIDGIDWSVGVVRGGRGRVGKDRILVCVFQTRVGRRPGL